MKCFFCDAEARGVCAFCSRAVCKEHARGKTFFSGFGRNAKDALLLRGFDAGVVVEDALWCGTCKVEYRTTY